MKGFAENFITPEEATHLKSKMKPPGSGKILIKDLPEDSTESFVVERLRDHFDFDLHEESYISIEHNPKGHRWHVDTGDRNHMPWCSFGCSVMLSKDYEYVGGLFHYRDAEIQAEHCGLLWHDSSEEHMVERHQGVRAVLLIFI
jgi:hypothetical protein